MRKDRVLVVGAGIAGLAAAQSLKRLGVPFHLIERAKALTPAGAGIALPANATAAMRYLGLGDALDATAHRVSKIHYLNEGGDLLSSGSLVGTPPLNRDHFVALSRTALHEILASGLEDQIQFDTTVTVLEEEAGAVSVCLDEAGQRTDPQTYSAVIGADGLHSRTRAQLFGETDLVDLGVTNWRWTCKFDTSDLPPSYFLAFRDVFMAYPFGEHDVYCYAHVNDPDNHYGATAGAGVRDLIKDRFADYGGVVPELLERLPANASIIPGRLRSVPKPFFGEGCVALVGDASNGCSPMLQQGAAGAFEGSIVLTELLAHFPASQAVHLYEDYLAERMKLVLTGSDMGIKTLAGMNQAGFFAVQNAIRKDGPLNIQGWEKLLAHDPLDGLEKFIDENKVS